MKVLPCNTLYCLHELFTCSTNCLPNQFSSVTQSCPTLCNPMNRSTPGLPVHHQLLEFTQTHIHRVSDAIQPSHPLLSPSSPAPNLSQHQNLLQSCLTLCDPIDGSPPGSPVPGILQARTLEWVAISFCNARKWKVKVKSLSHVRLLATPWIAAYQSPPSMGFSRQEYWSGVPLPSFPSSLSCLKLLAITDIFAISIVLPFSRMSYGWNHRVCSLSYWFLLLSNRHLSFLHIFSWFDKSFLFTHCMDPFTYWKTSWALAVLAIINKIALNIHGKIFFTHKKCVKFFYMKYLETQLLDHMVKLCLALRGKKKKKKKTGKTVFQESDTTEQLHFHFSLSCIGEGNGNPFQCSCLENPRDWGAWWAAVYGVAESDTSEAT